MSRIVREDGSRQNVVCAVFEVVAGGELLTECDRNKFSEGKARFYFRQLINGLEHIHARGYAHRDLKYDNVLLSRDRLTMKIIDFGFAISH